MVLAIQLLLQYFNIFPLLTCNEILQNIFNKYPWTREQDYISMFHQWLATKIVTFSWWMWILYNQCWTSIQLLLLRVLEQINLLCSLIFSGDFSFKWILNGWKKPQIIRLMIELNQLWLVYRAYQITQL